MYTPESLKALNDAAGDHVVTWGKLKNAVIEAATLVCDALKVAEITELNIGRCYFDRGELWLEMDDAENNAYTLLRPIYRRGVMGYESDVFPFEAAVAFCEEDLFVHVAREIERRRLNMEAAKKRLERPNKP